MLAQQSNSLFAKRQGRILKGIVGGIQLSLDITKAYDCVERGDLREALRMQPLPVTLQQQFWRYTTRHNFDYDMVMNNMICLFTEAFGRAAAYHRCYGQSFQAGSFAGLNLRTLLPKQALARLLQMTFTTPG